MTHNVEIQRKGVGDFVDRANDISRWGSYLERSLSGGVFLHPSLVLSGLRDYDNSLIYTRTADGGGTEGSLSGLAILRPHDVRIGLISSRIPAFRLKGYTLLNSQIIGGDSQESIMPFIRAFSQILGERHAEYVYFDDVDVGSSLWAVIRDVAQERRKMAMVSHRPAQPRHYIRFPEKAADYWKHFSAKTRSTFRRKAGKFEHRLLIYSRPEDVPVFLEKANYVSKRSWQATRLGKHVGNSASEQEVWTLVARQGAFRSYVLEHQGAPAAFVLGTQWKGYYSYEEVGYDQTYSPSSPGTILMYRLIEDLISRDTPHVFDFTFGDAPHKQMFANVTTFSGPVLLVRKCLRTTMALGVERLSVRLSRLMRWVARRTGMLSYLRRRHRRTDGPKESE